MKILVTGGSGFIGRHVVTEALRRGHQLLVLSRSPSADTGVECVRQDLTRPVELAAAIAGVDAVIHCSAAMGGDLSTQLAVTVEGTRNLLSAMQKAGISHIVSLSTFAIYDYVKLREGSVLDEESPLEENFDRRAPYIRAKRNQEDLVREQSTANGWRYTILRPGLVYGKDRTWFHQIGVQLNPRLWVCLAQDSVLPLTYVENCAAAVVNAAESKGAQNATLNIIDDNLPERRRYVRFLRQHAALRPLILGVPWAVLDGAAHLTALVKRTVLKNHGHLPDLLQIENLHARCKPLQYSNAKAKRLLGWEPRWSIEEGLVRSLNATKSPSGTAE